MKHTLRSTSFATLSLFVAGLFALLAMTVGPSAAQAATLYRQLQLGMSGSDVSSLQAFLAQDATLYPQGLVTGYFGTLTKSAVANFQARNGIAQSGDLGFGRVGPATLPVLIAQMAGGVSVGTGGVAPVISNITISPSTNSAALSWNTNESARGVVHYSSSPLVTYERTNSVDVSGNTAMADTNFRTLHSVSLSNLSANTTYYFLVYTTDQDGNVSVTMPSSFRTTN